jgi:hypothetical protein
MYVEYVLSHLLLKSFWLSVIFVQSYLWHIRSSHPVKNAMKFSKFCVIFGLLAMAHAAYSAAQRMFYISQYPT